jgi:hypothetical protein
VGWREPETENRGTRIHKLFTGFLTFSRRHGRSLSIEKFALKTFAALVNFF